MIGPQCAQGQLHRSWHLHLHPTLTAGEWTPTPQKRAPESPPPAYNRGWEESSIPWAGPREVPGLLISLTMKIAHNTPGERVCMKYICSFEMLLLTSGNITFRWFHFPLLNTSSLEWDLNVDQTVMGMRPKINIDCYGDVNETKL